MDQNNSHWPKKTNEPNFEFELIFWKLETLHVKLQDGLWNPETYSKELFVDDKCNQDAFKAR